MGSVDQNESGEVTISWKDHNKLLAEGLRQLLQEGYLVDANVTFKGTCFKVHRLIMAVFLPNIKAHMNDANPNVVSTAGSSQMLSMDYVANDVNDVKTLLDFLYYGEVTIQRERVEQIGQLAKDLNVESLAKTICDWEESMSQACADDGSEVNNNGSSVASDEGTRPNLGGNSQLDLAEVSAGLGVRNELEQNGDDCGPSSDCNESAMGATSCTLSTTSRETMSASASTISTTTSRPPAKSRRKDAKRITTTPKTETGVPSGRREKNRGFTKESEPESDSESEATSELSEESEDDNDWLPENSVKCRSRHSVRKQKTSSASTHARARWTSGPTSSGNVVDDPKERVAVDQFCQQVLQTWTDVKEMCKGNKRGEGQQAQATTRRRCRTQSDKRLVAVDSSTAIAELPACDKCNEKFLTLRSLNFHKKRCGQLNDYVCQECGHRTATRKKLQWHSRIHSKVKSAELFLSCPRCDYICNAKYKLRGHILRRHAPEREHKCPECEYSAMYKGEIERHVSRAHRKESRFVCEVCGARYQMRNSLNLHVIVKHQGIKPFKCEHCRKEYTNKQTLKLHVQTKHTLDVQKHICDVCGSSYIKRWGLQYHMRHAHGTSLAPLRKPYALRNPPVQQEQERSMDKHVISETLMPSFENIAVEMFSQNMGMIEDVVL